MQQTLKQQLSLALLVQTVAVAACQQELQKYSSVENHKKLEAAAIALSNICQALAALKAAKIIEIDEAGLDLLLTKLQLMSQE